MEAGGPAGGQTHTFSNLVVTATRGDYKPAIIQNNVLFKQEIMTF